MILLCTLSFFVHSRFCCSEDRDDSEDEVCGVESFGTGSDHILEKDGVWYELMFTNNAFLNSFLVTSEIWSWVPNLNGNGFQGPDRGTVDMASFAITTFVPFGFSADFALFLVGKGHFTCCLLAYYTSMISSVVGPDNYHLCHILILTCRKVKAFGVTVSASGCSEKEI
nr:alpha-D-glucose phosphate-specific phosphoglucomutase [Ipomoea batatas]